MIKRFLPLIAILLLASTAKASDIGTSGSLSRYAPGVMPRVVQWRHEHGIPDGFDPYLEYDGYIALMDCRDVGKVATAYLMIESEWSGPYRFLVSDCTEHPVTKRWMRDNRIAGELDYETWQRLGIVDGRGAWAEIEVDGD